MLPLLYIFTKIVLICFISYSIVLICYFKDIDIHYTRPAHLVTYNILLYMYHIPYKLVVNIVIYEAVARAISAPGEKLINCFENENKEKKSFV